MPDTRGEVCVDAPLTHFAVELGVGQGFAHTELAPVVQCDPANGGKYFIFDGREELDAQHSAEVDDKEFAHEDKWSGRTADYACKSYRRRHFLKRRVIAAAPSIVKLEQRTTRKLKHKNELGIDIRFKAAVEDEAVVTGIYNVGVSSVCWDAASAVVIEKNIDHAKAAFEKACGMEPTHILLPKAVSRVVKRDSTVRGLVKYTQSDLLVNGDLPPTIFNMKTVIPGALNNTANQGQTASIDYIWSADDVYLFYVDPDPDTDTLTAAAQFREPLEGIADILVESYVEPGRKGKWVEVSLNTVLELVCPKAIYKLKNVLT